MHSPWSLSPAHLYTAHCPPLGCAPRCPPAGRAQETPPVTIMDESVRKALNVLGFNDAAEHPPKMKIVTRRYYDLSLIHHPDRPGGDNATYQPITEAYRILGDFIEKFYEPKNDNTEE